MTTPFRAAIFDVDGVLVDSPHERAWRDSLRELMESDWSGIRHRTTWSPDAFTARLYHEEIAGRPRASGARAALEHFGVPDLDARVDVYARRKQAMVVRLIESGEYVAYPDGLRFIIALKDAGMRVAAASSSASARLLARRIRLDAFAREQGISSPSVRPGLTLLELFDVDVSGRPFARGKPDPEMFLTAARELGAVPEDVIVLEDAPAGVAAARAGGMVVIGIARAHDADLLEASGADIVVATLDEVDLGALAGRRLERRRASPRRGGRRQ